MGIRFFCPSGHKLNVKSFLAGKRAICPQCGAKVLVPDVSDSPLPGTPLPPAGIPTNPVSGPAGSTIPSPQDTASPSVILSMAGSEVAPTLESYDEIELETVEPGLPESVVLAARAPISATELAAPDAKQELQRARHRHTQFVIAIVLLVLVIVLAMILIWVLRRNAIEPVSEPEKTAQASFETSASGAGVLVCRQTGISAPHFDEGTSST